MDRIIRSRGKSHSALRRTAMAAALMAAGLSHLPAWSDAALPTGGQVSTGSGTIAQSANQVTITQTSARLAIDWQSFSIGAGNTVRFDQPSASSVALNRVLGPDASVIQGKLQANGQVFLLNPNGVLFTPTAQVNVGSLVASTLQLSNQDFLAGRYRFDGNSTQAVHNQGRIETANGGTVALIAAQVVNSGTIATPRGATLLGAGQTVTLDLGGPAKLEVERGAVQALIDNGGAILAPGGRILLTAKAADALAGTVINQTGLLEAQSLGADARGQIVLKADGGTIVAGGRIDAAGGDVIVLSEGAGSDNNTAGPGFYEVPAGNATLSGDIVVQLPGQILTWQNYSTGAGDAAALIQPPTSAAPNTVAAGNVGNVISGTLTVAGGTLSTSGATTLTPAGSTVSGDSLSTSGALNVSVDASAFNVSGINASSISVGTYTMAPSLQITRTIGAGSNAVAGVQGQPLRPSLQAAQPPRGSVKLQIVQGGTPPFVDAGSQ